MKLLLSITSLGFFLLIFLKTQKEETNSYSDYAYDDAIIIEGHISSLVLKTFNGCGIGNFLIPSTGASASGQLPLIGALTYDWDLKYNILDTIPGNEIKGLAFQRESWLENSSIIHNDYGQESPYVVISDTGLFSYFIPPEFDPYSHEITAANAIFVPDILKVAKEFSFEFTDPIVLLIKDSVNYSIKYYSYPELQEQAGFSFHFEPELFEVDEDHLFLAGPDTTGDETLYQYSIAQNSLIQTYLLNDSVSNAQELIKSGDSLFIISSPGDSMAVLSVLNLADGSLSQSMIYSESGLRATNNEFKGDRFFTFQPVSDSTNSFLDKQILILNPISGQTDTLVINRQLDYFKNPSNAPQSFGSFSLDWVAAKWADENNLDSVFISQFSNVLKIQTGAIPKYINATYGCWVGVKENEREQIKFEVYPNPASSFVTINLAGLNKEVQYQLDIVDHSGRFLFTTTLSAYQKINLPLEEFVKGIYFLNLNTGKNLISKKLIIQ